MEMISFKRVKAQNAISLARFSVVVNCARYSITRLLHCQVGTQESSAIIIKNPACAANVRE